jgi:hypothetical protein
MIENLSPFINWAFALVTILTVVFYLYAVREKTRQNAFLLITAGVLVFLLGIHASLAFNGFYLVKTVPSRFFLALFPTILILLILWFSFARHEFSTKSLRILTLLSVIRLPVEIILLELYRAGQVPQLMTFEGRNLDILSGLTAPVIAWLGFRGDRANRPLLIGWNLLALGLLLNILINAILSLETPFQQFAFDQPNRGVLYFPFIWLPAIIVPIVFVSHIISLWSLVKNSESFSHQIYKNIEVNKQYKEQF